MRAHTPRFPNAIISADIDGNAFSIMAHAGRALRKAGATPAEIAQYRAEATSGDYDNLLRVTMDWATFGDEEGDE